jgi:hypothetical protein
LKKPPVCYKIHSIKQAALPLSLNVKKTRKAEFLEQMERLVAGSVRVVGAADLFVIQQGMSAWEPSLRGVFSLCDTQVKKHPILS